MSTARQGMVGTGNPSAPEPPDPGAVAERRAQALATAETAIPPDTVLITSRQPEAAPFNIVLDMDHVLTGGRLASGFVIWYCPTGLVERLKRHMLAVGNRIVFPEEPPKTEHHEHAKEAKK